MSCRTTSAAMTCDSPRRVAVLYHTQGCHLCEIALELVAPLAAERGWLCELSEISTDDALMSRYGLRIPVLRDPACGRELDWPFSGEAVIGFFES
jgi:Glutaredoxin-like domain (DUF836)